MDVQDYWIRRTREPDLASCRYGGGVMSLHSCNVAVMYVVAGITSGVYFAVDRSLF